MILKGDVNLSTDNSSALKSRPILKKMLMSLSVAIFCSFTVMFFSPIGIVYGNINQFTFKPIEVMPILLVFCLAVTAVMTVVGTLLPFKASLILNSVEFAAGLCCYVQSFFLNGKMGSLTGDAHNYGNLTVILNIAVWVFIIIAITVSAILLIKFQKEKLLRSIAVFISLSLFAMQLTAFITSAISAPGGRGISYYLSDIGEYEISSNQNTIVFIVDTCDGRYIDQTYDEYPDMFDGLDGFVYYPDATSTHSRTYPSMPYLLTGEICHFDKPYHEFVNDAFDGSNYVQDIKSTDCNVGIYTDDQYIGKKGMQTIDNSANNSTLYISKYGTIKQMAKMSLYRVVPYAFKSRFVYGSAPVNSDVLRVPADQPKACIKSDDLAFYNRLVSEGITVSDEYDKAFRLYHMWGAHPGGKFNEKMQYSNAGSTEQCTRGNFLIIQKYIEQMKQLGVYENSTIIITADHGKSQSTNSPETLEIDSPPTVAMFVKPAGCGMANEGLTVSNAPVCHADLFSTVIDSLGGSYEKYGVPVWDHAEDEQRTRYYYYQALYSDIDGEIALREYSIDGDARDFSNWKLTGNNWDILYSERTVSKHRLSEKK